MVGRQSFRNSTLRHSGNQVALKRSAVIGGFSAMLSPAPGLC
jgi:hypothetical protein